MTLPIHTEKGLKLAAALLGPLLSTVLFDWLARARARRQRPSPSA